MALVKFKTGIVRSFDANKAREMWLVKSGEIHGTKAQKLFVRNIERIYLNRYNAPISYLKAYSIADDRVAPNQMRLPYKD